MQWKKNKINVYHSNYSKPRRIPFAYDPGPKITMLWPKHKNRQKKKVCRMTMRPPVAPLRK